MKFKKMLVNLLYGCGSGETDYEFNNVRYIVDSHFQSSADGSTSIHERFGSCLTHLTTIDDTNKISNGYVYSTAGKED